MLTWVVCSRAWELFFQYPSSFGEIISFNNTKKVQPSPSRVMILDLAPLDTVNSVEVSIFVFKNAL